MSISKSTKKVIKEALEVLGKKNFGDKNVPKS